MKSRLNRAFLAFLMAAAILTGETADASEDHGPATSSVSAQQEPSPLTQLAWENDHMQVVAKPNEANAEFSFSFTNISDAEVIIDHVKTSCSCTAAKLPSAPWHLPPHTNGQVGVTVDLKGKTGDFDKMINVFFADTNVPPKLLRVTVKMPDRKMMREKNMQLSLADRQSVFKGDCAKCHAEPAKTATGMALYHEICGICHEARPRATMVPELRLLPHPTDYAFWKEMIAHGKPGTLMPAFATSQGGPLTDQQVDALAKDIEAAFPYSRFGGHPPQAAPAVSSPDQPVLKPVSSPPKS